MQAELGRQRESFTTKKVFLDPVGAKLGVFSDAQAPGLHRRPHLHRHQQPEARRSARRQGQVTMEAEVLRLWWREIIGSGRSRP